jgi:dTDP-4-amino-4,6-dideoxygalactose transaminase
MAGRPCDMDSIGKIAMNYKLKVVEDAAHAFGAEYHKQKIGTISDLTAFSFYATKNLVTGEGGMVTTSNDEYADFIRVNSLHGMSKDAWKRYSDEGFKHYLIEYPGYKYNMMDMQAAIGIHQLKRFNSGQERRKEIWSIYNKAFRNLPLTTPMDPEHNTVHGYHLYTILIDTKKVKASRDQVQAALHAENIGIGIHFIALHLHPFYKNKYGYKRGDFPNSEYISDRTISIPLGSNLSKGDVNDVIAAVTKVVNYYTSHSPLPQKVHLPKAAKDSKE